MKGTATVDDKKIDWQTTADVGFKCQKCGYCCIATNVHLFKQDIERIKKKGYKDFYRPSESGFRIKGTKTRKCIFLDENNTCKIYDIRPFVCREYPFKVVFLDKDTAFIDVLYSCKSIIKGNGKLTEKFFNELIKNSLHLNEKFLNLKKEINEIEIKLDKKRWNNNIDELNYLNDLLDLYKTFSPEEEIDFKFFIKKFFELFKNQLKKESLYRVLDLDKDEFYKINATDDFILINNKKLDLDDTKKLQSNFLCPRNAKHFCDVKRKKFNEESKKIIINYLKNYWNRKATVIDFHFALEHLKKEGKDMEVYDLQKEVLKRILLLLQFFLLIISHKNNNIEITKKDALETIFCLDSTLFTPMEAILPGLGKRFFKPQS